MSKQKTLEYKAAFIRGKRAELGLQWGQLASRLKISRTMISFAVNPKQFSVICDKIVKELEKEEKANG